MIINLFLVLYVIHNIPNQLLRMYYIIAPANRPIKIKNIYFVNVKGSHLLTHENTRV